VRGEYLPVGAAAASLGSVLLHCSTTAIQGVVRQTPWYQAVVPHRHV